MNEEFMREAIRLSAEQMRLGRGGPFGAVVVRDGIIIGRGWNQVTVNNDPTAHAEVVAIREACRAVSNFRLEEAEIYTSCEPCPMCLAAIYWARIRQIYYANSRQDAARAGFDDELIYREVAQPLDRRRIPAKQILASEAGKIFAEWAVLPNRVTY